MAGGTQDVHFSKGYQAVPSRPSGKCVGGKQSKFCGNEEGNYVVKGIVGSVQQRNCWECATKEKKLSI